jgi:hypothetical protein
MIKKQNIFKVFLVVLALVIWLVSSHFLEKPCVGALQEIKCLYDYKIGIFQPAYFGALWLTGVFIAMALVPWHIYKKWLLTVLPITLLITFWLVSNISPKSGFLLNPSRAQMMVQCMMVLVFLTTLFVGGHLFYDWRKGKPETAP